MEIKNFRVKHDKDFILELIEEGEHENQDFKYSISDSRKIARSIAAFANNSGGRLLVGVKDNGNIAGIRSDEELYMIEQAAEMYCKPSQKVAQSLYCAEGKYVLLVSIGKSDVPVLAQDDDKVWRPYYRVNDENIRMPDLMLRARNACSKNRDTALHFTETEAKLLSFVETNNGVSSMDIAKSLHLSLAFTESTVVALCALGVLDFVYTGGKWLIVAVNVEK